MVENLPATAGDAKRLRCDPWVGKIPRSSRILVWRVPRTEEPGGLQPRHTASDTAERVHTHAQPRGAAAPARPELMPVSLKPTVSLGRLSA